MVLNDPAGYLPEDSKQEMTAMKIVTGRRGALKTFALTMTTSAIGLASAGDRPAAAAVESALTPAGATHLEALKKRLAQARAMASNPHIARWIRHGTENHDVHTFA